MEYLKILTTIVLAVFGWVIANNFNSNRDLKNRKREIILPFLIQNYQVLTHDICMRKPDDNLAKKLEKLISDIQLFGSSKQVELVRRLAEDATKEKDYGFDLLVNDLRNELRKELNLCEIKRNVMWFRKKIS